MEVHCQEVSLLPEVGCAEVVTVERLHIAPRSENLRRADGVAVGRSLVGAGEVLLTVLVANFSQNTSWC